MANFNNNNIDLAWISSELSKCVDFSVFLYCMKLFTSRDWYSCLNCVFSQLFFSFRVTRYRILWLSSNLVSMKINCITCIPVNGQEHYPTVLVTAALLSLAMGLPGNLCRYFLGIFFNLPANFSFRRLKRVSFRHVKTNEWAK